jgi:ABC-type multidrug transport system permease subunit
MSTLSNFFLNDLTSSINSGERLNIFVPVKSNNLFSQMKDFYLCPAGYLLLIFGSFSILLGYETFRSREYTKFLASLYPYKKLLWILLISQIILLILFLLLILILLLACLFIYGVNLINLNFLIFLSTALLVFTFLFLNGFVVGLLRSKPAKLVSLVLIFFFFFFVFQGIVTKVVEKRATYIKSYYNLHLEKLKLIMSIERDSYNKFGRFESGKEAPEDLKRFVKQAVLILIIK